MPGKTGRRTHRVRTVLILLITAAAAYVAWGYLSPLLATGSQTVYEGYTAQRGDIRTHKSFAASLEVLNSETHTNTADVTSIRKLYVQSGQQVQEDDKLLQLENGTILRAGIDGTVNEMRFGEGDWVWPRVQLIQICDLENLQVSLQVDEYDVDKVSAGQNCTVTIVPLGIDFETTIRHVNRLAEADRGVAYYSVTAELTVPEHVLPGMTASVSIPAEEALDVVTLDMAALSFDEEKQPYVLIPNGETYEKRIVETGLSDGMKVEILSGVSEGDVVYTAREEEIEAAGFSLASIYKQIAGEKVVINDLTGGGRAGRAGGMPASDGMERPAAPAEGTQTGRPSQPENRSGGAPASPETQSSGGDMP